MTEINDHALADRQHPPGDPSDARAAQVRGMFDRIADRYDRINDLMTLGRHRAWKRQLVKLVGIGPGDRVLDLCTGTGDLAVLAARAADPGGHVTAVDFSPEMLERARRRHAPSPANIEWKRADALFLPFDDATFDAALVGFGLRNVSDLDRALRELHRVLRPGGRLGSLDLGKPRNPLLKAAADLYSFRTVPLLATAAGAPRDAYEYLPASNLAFPDQRELARRLESAGFTGVSVHDRAFGAIALLIAGR